jgi:hypothetical protein
VNETTALALIYSAPLAIPAMVWFCVCLEIADIINHPERQRYLMLAYVSMQDGMVTYSDESRRRDVK